MRALIIHNVDTLARQRTAVEQQLAMLDKLEARILELERNTVSYNQIAGRAVMPQSSAHGDKPH